MHAVGCRQVRDTPRGRRQEIQISYATLTLMEMIQYQNKATGLQGYMDGDSTKLREA